MKKYVFIFWFIVILICINTFSFFESKKRSKYWYTDLYNEYKVKSNFWHYYVESSTCLNTFLKEDILNHNEKESRDKSIKYNYILKDGINSYVENINIDEVLNDVGYLYISLSEDYPSVSMFKSKTLDVNSETYVIRMHKSFDIDDESINYETSFYKLSSKPTYDKRYPTHRTDITEIKKENLIAEIKNIDFNKEIDEVDKLLENKYLQVCK